MADLHTFLTSKPLGLILDIDGTLSPLAPTPGEARLYPGVADLLAEANQYAHVAIMTGRALTSGAALVNVEGLTYIGTHGMEWCEGLPSTGHIQVVPEATPFIQPGQKLFDLVEQQLANLPGILIERKSVGGSIHYRRSPNPAKTKKIILETLREPARLHKFILSEAKYTIEIKADITVNKGQALRRFTQKLNLQGIFFAGDDRTDLDAVLETKRLREGGRRTFAVVVQATDTLPELLAQADLIVQGVPGMAQLLQEIVNQLVTA